MRILFYLDDYPHEIWRDALLAENPDLEFRSYPDWGSPDDGPAYALVWEPKPGLLKDYPNIQAIFSMGAGIDHLTRDPELPKDTPIIRMGDDGLKEGMAEFMAMSVLMHHRQMPYLMEQQKVKSWARVFAPAAKDVQVGIMGYGALGKAAAEKLKPFGYNLVSWSRTTKAPEEGITHYSGTETIDDFLAGTNILVCLLPETKETINLLNKERLLKLPQGASIINGGRGGLIELSALEEVMTSGHIESATLDVFPKEPLDTESALWKQEKLIITPHIAAITRPDTAANYVVRNIKKLETGEEPENKLDLNRGY